MACKLSWRLLRLIIGAGCLWCTLRFQHAWWWSCCLLGGRWHVSLRLLRFVRAIASWWSFNTACRNSWRLPALIWASWCFDCSGISACLKVISGRQMAYLLAIAEVYWSKSQLKFQYGLETSCAYWSLMVSLLGYSGVSACLKVTSDVWQSPNQRVISWAA